MKTNIQKLTCTALMAAVICILSPFAIPIPISETPISLGTFAVYLAACLLGWKLGTVSVLIYLLLGCVGVPVFTGSMSGISRLAGPTGGYLIGYLTIALIVGWFVDHFETKLPMYFVGLVLGTATCYLFGTLWMKISLHLSWKAAISAGVIPYLPLDTVKIVLAGFFTFPVRRQLKRLLPELMQNSNSKRNKIETAAK